VGVDTNDTRGGDHCGSLLSDYSASARLASQFRYSSVINRLAPSSWGNSPLPPCSNANSKLTKRAPQPMNVDAKTKRVESRLAHA
jgi:hypothetical protein